MARTIHVIGNKVRIPDELQVSRHECSNKLVFVGKMSYEPNVVATTHFATRVFPKLLSRFPELRFVIVGANPNARVRQLAELRNVEVTGFVDSVEPFFQGAAIVVAPMLTGAGIQNKIIQAMSYGCCVVTTPIGAEGLDIHHEEIAEVEGDNEMATTIASLLLAPERRKTMGKIAREYVISHLSESVISEQFWEFIDGVSPSCQSI